MIYDENVTIGIDDSIYDKFMGFLELLPNSEVKVDKEDDRRISVLGTFLRALLSRFAEVCKI